MKLTNLTLLTYKLYENFKTSCWGVLHIWRLCCNMFCKKQSAIIIINMKQTNLLLKNWLRLHSSSGPSLEKSTPALLLVSKIVKTRAGVHANTPAPVHLWAALNGWSIDGAHRYVTEHGQDWIYCRILAIFLDQNWIWIFIFEKNWFRTGSRYLFDFYYESFLTVIQDVTNDVAVVFFAVIHIHKKSKWFCRYVLHSSQSMIIRVTSS